MKAHCNGGWFPAVYNGCARSISQMYRNGDAEVFEKPFPYMVTRPFITQDSNGFEINRSVENGFYSGFKSQHLIRSQADAEAAAAYMGATSSILLLGLHNALQYTDEVHLRLSHPNNPVVKRQFEALIGSVLNLVSQTLVDENGKGFRFSSVEFVDEATCNIAGASLLGINGILGAYFTNGIFGDTGGSTTDVSITTASGKKIILPAIPIAGRMITISSLIQIARMDGWVNSFAKIESGMRTVIDCQINPIIEKRIEAGMNAKDVLEQLVNDPELQEACQVLLDYFGLTLNVGKSQLLQSLVCFKDLIVQDIVLHQSSKVFTKEDFEKGNLYLLRLGNGSRSVDLYCDKLPYSSSKEKLEQILRDRADHYMGTASCLQAIHNKSPKSEVSNGLACYDPNADSSIRQWEDEGVQTPKELMDKHLETAVQRAMELARWLKGVVPEICGQIHPLYSGGVQSGFSELIQGLDDANNTRVILREFINHENGRLGSIYQMSADMGVDVWVGHAVMDHVNRRLVAVHTAK